MESSSKPLFDIQTRSGLYALEIFTDQLPKGSCRYVFNSKRCAKKAAKFFCETFGVVDYKYKIRPLKYVKLIKRK